MSTDTATAVDAWFVEWHSYHTGLHPHRAWIDPVSDLGLRYYEGWIEALAKRGVTLAEAKAASRRIQQQPPSYPEKHLGAILTAVAEVRSERRAAAPGACDPDAPATPEQSEAARASASCPECHGSGWATRRAVWRGLSAVFFARLYCRCPHGRWRADDDPGRHDPFAGSEPDYDDLQALGDLWDFELVHPTWSDVAASPRRARDARLRYLHPSEPAPAPTPYLSRAMARGIGRRVGRAAAERSST